MSRQMQDFLGHLGLVLCVLLGHGAGQHYSPSFFPSSSLLPFSPHRATGKPLRDRVSWLVQPLYQPASRSQELCWVSALLKTSDLSQNHSWLYLKLVWEEAGMLVDRAFCPLASPSYLPACPNLQYWLVWSFIISFSELLGSCGSCIWKHLTTCKARWAFQMRNWILYQNSISFYSQYLIEARGLVL